MYVETGKVEMTEEEEGEEEELEEGERGKKESLPRVKEDGREGEKMSRAE